MTFNITKTYRQKTKEVVELCKTRGGSAWCLTASANSNSNELLGCEWIKAV